jgi:hypothetical protein
MKGRLGDVEFFGRPREVQVVGENGKGSKGVKGKRGGIYNFTL